MNLLAGKDQAQQSEVLDSTSVRGAPVGKSVITRVVGRADEIRSKLASEGVAFLNSIEGVKDVERDCEVGNEQVELHSDYEKR